MQKRKLFNLLRSALAVVLIGTAAAAAAADTKMVVVVERDGSTYDVAMPEMDKIEFAGDGFMIIHDGVSKWFDYSQVDRILLGAPATSVESIASEGRLVVWPSPAVDTVNIAGLPDGAETRAYTTGGVLVASAVSADGIARLDVTNAPAGTLIVAADGRTVKIIKL